MTRITTRAVPALAMVMGLSTVAHAQDIPAGQYEYDVACAICHGESGKGMGPMAEFLNLEVPGLTGLAAANEGVYPWLQVFLVIDGRTGVQGHGGAMPIWGDRYKMTAQQDFGPYGAEIVTRGRIAVLTDYIQSIQE
jgi:mono/diheme cytochrome c family protein